MKKPLEIDLTIETVIAGIGDADEAKPRALAEKVKKLVPEMFAKLADEMAISFLAENIRKKLGSTDGPRQQLELFGDVYDVPEFIALSGLGSGRVWKKLMSCPPAVIERNLMMREAGIAADQAERDRINDLVVTARNHGCGEHEAIGAWLKRTRPRKKKPARKATAEKAEGAPA